MDIILTQGEGEEKRFSGVTQIRFIDIDLRVEEFINLITLYMEGGFSVDHTNAEEVTITVNQKVSHKDRIRGAKQ